ncbi:MAG TPA: hypothetical protein VIM12_11145 [Noviherbaspirillum sp.]|jgi:hypothetical protein|uniref:hypothetical protein n=1 Tax=Noviherbaspirillum sp. TaxID=1926288 RepID=UPI002F95D193
MPVQVATQIPWKELIKLVPTVVAATRDLRNKWGSKQQAPEVDPHAEVKTQIATVTQRLATLESAGAEQADVMKQIAEQLQGVSAGLAETARRATTALWTGLAALAIGTVAVVVAVIVAMTGA